MYNRVYSRIFEVNMDLHQDLHNITRTSDKEKNKVTQLQEKLKK